MIINTFTPISTATQVWNNANRSLTNFGPMLTLLSTLQTSLASAANVLFTPGAGVQDMTIAAVAGTSQFIFSLWDGTNENIISSGTNASGGQVYVGTVAAVRARLRNGGANPLNYMACGGFYLQ